MGTNRKIDWRALVEESKVSGSGGVHPDEYLQYEFSGRSFRRHKDHSWKLPNLITNPQFTESSPGVVTSWSNINFVTPSTGVHIGRPETVKLTGLVTTSRLRQIVTTTAGKTYAFTCEVFPINGFGDHGKAFINNGSDDKTILSNADRTWTRLTTEFIAQSSSINIDLYANGVAYFHNPRLTQIS